MAIPANDVFEKLLTPEQLAAADKRGEELIAAYLRETQAIARTSRIKRPSDKQQS